MKKIITLAVVASALLFTACTQETQNKIGRSIQNWTGTDGVMDVYAGEKLVKRFIKVDKMTTGTNPDTGEARAYRYSYGYLDKNFNYEIDPGEKKVYFEVSTFSNAIFYDNPRD
jgi:predicted small secreted protein